MARANVAPGFGLESGSPEQLRRIRKTGKLQGYLDQMRTIAGWARELGVPFGANVIVGHPGETEQSLRASARYLEDLFLGEGGATTGFLSVDPFRLYPGSQIDRELEVWRQETGMRTHRYPWWHDGDQDFLAEWIDPSAGLDFRAALQLRRELFDPIVQAIPCRFAYTGPARDYFVRAIDEQVALTKPRRYLRQLGLWHLWHDLAGEPQGTTASARLAADDELGFIAGAARRATVDQAGFTACAPLRRAMERVPRERFVPLEHVGESADDCALPLCADGCSTVSALHAYAVAYEALALGPGDALVDLGGGTGYGAALAAELVGPAGRVLCIEIEPELAAKAREILAGYPQVQVVAADAHETERWRGASKIYAGFAVRGNAAAGDPAAGPLAAWLEALAPGGRLVVPVAGAGGQELTLFEKSEGGICTRALGPVVYVGDRTDAAALSVRISAIAHGGEGVGTLATGKKIFVPLTAPGDLAAVEIVADARQHARGRMTRLLVPGPGRVALRCRHAGRCGGCQLQHLAAPDQLAAKEATFYSALERLGGLPRGDIPDARPIVPSPAAFGYRSRCRLRVAGKAVGFCGWRTSAVVDLAQCPVLAPALEQVARDAAARLRERPLPGLHDLHLCVGDGEAAAAALGLDRPPGRRLPAAARELAAALPALQGLVVLSPHGALLASVGDSVLCAAAPLAPGVRLHLRPDVFAQANPGANLELVRAVVGLLDPGPAHTVLDLYAGSGNFSFALAARGGVTIAVEQSADALALARRSAQGAATAPRPRFVQDDALAACRRLAEGGEQVDLVLLDPPRAGAKELPAALARLGPRRIACVSCDPATLARDVRALRGHGYGAAAALAVDMFPQTYHVEGVVLLERA
ncbi:MAG: RsmD family RNA methyltransferase [Deltaproteobacteria bacterium]|nr:RsmD family RNA methyltransferase [Deltaproteobacteria bacterium]